MKKILLLVFFSDCLVFPQASAQMLRLTQIRVGFDPVFTASQLMPGIHFSNNTVKYRNWEANIEFIGPYRLSVLGEIGQTSLDVLLYSATIEYHCSGTYARAGMNFDLSKPNKNYEYDLGWRLCTSSYSEDASTNLKGTYWGENVSEQVMMRSNSFFWAEILLESKYRIFPSSQNVFRNFWFGYSMRLKINPFPDENKKELIPNQYIPGFGVNYALMGGIQFNLIYAFHLLGKEVHKGKHLHDNLDIIEKNHHIYKIKKHTDSGGDINRD